MSSMRSGLYLKCLHDNNTNKRATGTNTHSFLLGDNNYFIGGTWCCILPRKDFVTRRVRLAPEQLQLQTVDDILTHDDGYNHGMRHNWCEAASVPPSFGELCQAQCESSTQAVLNFKCLFFRITHVNTHTHPLPHTQLDAGCVCVCC